MGKKVIAAAEKTSNTLLEKNKFNSMLKVLKPKVYITDSASFKGLVQQLTGNGPVISTDSDPEIEAVNRVLQSVVIPVVEQHIPIINIDDEDVMLAGEEDNLLLLDDDALALLDCLHSWNGQTSSSSSSACVGEGNWKMQENNQQLSDDSCFLKQTLPCFDVRNQEMAALEQYDMEWLEFQEVESWLLDSDQQQPFPPCAGQMMQQQIHAQNYNTLSTSWLQ